ncbi:MAG: ferredoxin family protein [Pseudomonadales bacterium]|jgi:NAD-dependent dihydropyrimidine dehydrogenase PreA subunit|nr:ferredoxin family protein [Pseudomonadales bacterium]
MNGGPETTAGEGRRPMGAERQTIPRGRVHVIPERCKECRYCVEFCPEKVLAFSTDVNARGYHYPVMAAGHEDDCVDCGFCTLICPELAIFTRPE